MTFTDSSLARVGASVVNAIASSTASFRQFMVYTSMNISSGITGAVGVVKNGDGTLTYSAICDYTGPTIINKGAISMTSASTLNGVISGSGSINKLLGGELTLRGNNTYTGGTIHSGGSSGIIFCGASNALGTGLVTCVGSLSIISTNVSITLPNNFITVGQLQFRIAIGYSATRLTISGVISGRGGIRKTNTGTVFLAGDNTYTGSTTITGGLLVVEKTNGAVKATATFSGQVPETPSLSVSFNTPPTSGMVFRFFSGPTAHTYSSITLYNGGGRSASYDSPNSTLTII